MSTAERVTASLNTYRALPKVELHRHLEGSLRLDTMVDIARQHGITIPDDILRVSTLVQIQVEDKFTFQNFLAKFNTLRLFYRSPDAIHRITREAIQLHGAIGFSEECDIGMFLKRAITLSAWLGGAEVHRRRYARLAPHDAAVQDSRNA